MIYVRTWKDKEDKHIHTHTHKEREEGREIDTQFRTLLLVPSYQLHLYTFQAPTQDIQQDLHLTCILHTGLDISWLKLTQATLTELL